MDALARKNVDLTMADTRRRSAVLADLATSGAVKIVGAMYNLENGAGRVLRVMRPNGAVTAHEYQFCHSS